MPSPWRTSTIPRTRSAVSAWRIDVRLTPSFVASSRSVISRSPGRSSSARMSSSSRWTTRS